MTVPESRSNFIWDCLEDLNYEAITEVDTLDDALSKGLQSAIFTQLVADLGNELANAANLSSRVSPFDDADKSIFHIELSSLLKEYGCAYPQLQDQSVFDSLETRLELVDYLAVELMTNRVVASKHGSDAMDTAGDSSAGLVSSPEECLKTIAQSLQLALVPGATTEQVFAQVMGKLEAALQALGPNYLGEPLLSSPLDADKSAKLADINAVLAEEYAVRRQMLLKRADVTVQSFKWSDRAKGLLDKIESVAQPLRRAMSTASDVDVNDVRYATTDLLRTHKTSSQGSRGKAQSVVGGVLIGHVRPRELAGTFHCSTSQSYNHLYIAHAADWTFLSCQCYSYCH
eukprot:TRINITY_DN8278_c0_g1_i3.p1 TRINITY_DN8278_c0_g1~~TRINITY_DN8278_c0_g1_i3.p1  ORF type:complete len:344 (+),score=73.79 TRINITY_DN8278_c0_g1_i3:118-1149(+)